MDLLRGVLAACSLSAAVAAGCTRTEAEQPGRLPEYLPPGESSSDSCLEGDWLIWTPNLSLLVANLVPMPGMWVPHGTLYLSAKDGEYAYGSNGFVIGVDLGSDSYLEGKATFLFTGTYDNPESGKVVLFGDGAQKQVAEWLAFKEGRTEQYPGGGPEVSVPLTGPARYECTPGGELVLYREGPAGEVPMILKR